MPKTGTSSIQESLHYGLTDPAFHYCSFGKVNVTRSIITLFAQAPEKHHTHVGCSAAKIERERKQLYRQLEKVITNAGNATLIFSAETCWGEMNSAEFVRIRHFMADRGYIVNVIGYIRPWKQWLESRFQQGIRGTLKTFQPIPDNPMKLDYRGRIQELEAIFGAEQVQIYLYDPQNFPAGCVVRDFCQHLGINFDFKLVRRVNDSLKLPAVQLLYAYRRFGPGYDMGATAVLENGWLNRRLSEVRGSAFRLHSSAVEPVITSLFSQTPWLEQRLGAPFNEDLFRYDNDVCIRTESDLFDFDAEALAWLAAAVHSKPVRPARGEEAARVVAVQMHKLRQSVPATVRVRRLVRRVINRLRFWQMSLR
jgi:hypothetical protein